MDKQEFIIEPLTDTTGTTGTPGTTPKRGVRVYKRASCPGHGRRPHYARGLCKSCYNKLFGRGRVSKAEKETIAALELPSSASSPSLSVGSDPTKIRYKDPRVAAFVARVLIKHRMDWSAASKEIFPGVAPGQAAIAAAHLESQPEIQKAIEENLAARGLDEKSKDRFVSMMWEWVEGDDPRLKIASAKILGRGFISEKIDLNKPQELPIRGFEAGVLAMLGGGRQDGQEQDGLDGLDGLDGHGRGHGHGQGHGLGQEEKEQVN